MLKQVRFYLISGTILGSAITNPTFAQTSASLQRHGETQNTAAPNDASEIVVTATRSEEKLSKVPLSVAAFSQAALDKRAVRAIDDVVKLTPGVNIERSSYGNGSGSNISIRGISSTVGAATTGIYIDDTPIQVRTLGFTATNPYPQVFDLERVEVLRGPQGTLFGAGAEGGTVRFISPKPSLSRLEIYGRTEVSATEGGGPSYEGGAAIGAPIIQDKLGFRVSANYRHSGGWVDYAPYPSTQVLDKNANTDNTLVLRGALTLSPTEAIQITPSIFYQREHIADTAGFWEITSNPAQGKFVNSNQAQEPSTDKFLLPSLNIQVGLGPLRVTSVTSYFKRDMHEIFDYAGFINGTFAGTAIPLFPNYKAYSNMRNTQRNFTQEFRIQSDPDARLRWVGGGFYSENRQVGYQSSVDPQFDQLIETIFGAPVAAVFGSPVLANNVVFLNINRGRDTQLAAFGQADFKITDRLTITAGGRVSKTKFAFSTLQDGPGGGGYATSAGVQKETPVTPKVGVSYNTYGGTLLYASASKGFRTGGVNTPIQSLACEPDLASLGYSQAPDTYKSDSVWNYEAGAKGHALNRTLSFDFSAYYIRWSNIQTEIYLSGCGLNFVTNAGKASSRGFDMSLTASPIKNLTITAAFGYFNARYDQNLIVGPSSVVRKGDRLPGSPFTIDISAQYGFPLGDYRGYARADYDHRSQYARREPDRDPVNFSYDAGLIPIQERNDVTLRVGAQFGGVDASLFVANALNEHPIVSHEHETTVDPIFVDIVPRPRTFGATVTYRY